MTRSAIICAMCALFCLGIMSCDKKANTTMTASGAGFELKDVGDHTVKVGDHDVVKVTIDRKGGFGGEVTVEVSGLPAGVTVEGGSSHKILAKDDAVSLKLMAGDGAAPRDKNDVRITASAMVEGKNLSKTDNFALSVKPRS